MVWFSVLNRLTELGRNALFIPFKLITWLVIISVCISFLIQTIMAEMTPTTFKCCQTYCNHCKENKPLTVSWLHVSS